MKRLCLQMDTLGELTREHRSQRKGRAQLHGNISVGVIIHLPHSKNCSSQGAGVSTVALMSLGV